MKVIILRFSTIIIYIVLAIDHFSSVFFDRALVESFSWMGMRKLLYFNKCSYELSNKHE